MWSKQLFLSVDILIIRLAEMEEKLRVLIDDQIEKLVLPSGIPPTVEELQTTVKENFGISQNLMITSLCITLTKLNTKIR